jgi:hypothetical protein
MDKCKIPDLNEYHRKWAEELNRLRQVPLQGEASFIDFAKSHGIAVAGVTTGDPMDFHKKGWLLSDGIDSEGEPLFHTFRVYPLYKILNACDLRIAPSSTLLRERMVSFVEQVLTSLPSIDEIGDGARCWNRIVDLAILLEPIYWPRITGWTRGYVGEKNGKLAVEQHRKEVLRIVTTLDPSPWREVHEQLRFDAEWLDGNGELYLLLRAGNWSQRERLKGSIAGAL